jgi:hypothetical protein
VAGLQGSRACLGKKQLTGTFLIVTFNPNLKSNTYSLGREKYSWVILSRLSLQHGRINQQRPESTACIASARVCLYVAATRRTVSGGTSTRPIPLPLLQYIIGYAGSLAAPPNLQSGSTCSAATRIGYRRHKQASAKWYTLEEHCQRTRAYIAKRGH